MKVKELIAHLQTKNPEAVVVAYMNGDLGPQLCGTPDEGKGYRVDNVENPTRVRHASDTKEPSNVEVVVLSGNED